MKGGLVAAAAAVLATGVSASNGHRHAHNLFHKKHEAETCVPTCVTSIVYVTGPPTLIQPKPTPPTTSVVVPVTTEAPPPPPTTSTEAPIISTPEVPLPTPQPHVCPTPGTYTFPATTVTVSQTTTVCGATTTAVTSGTHTVGGVTTVVETQTTVTCPVATVQTSGTVTHSTIVQTTYVCPSSGTYTIAPTTTVVPSDTTITVVVPTTICPGTYTQPEKVVTVTETDFTTYCPFESSTSSTVAPVTTSAVPVHTVVPTVSAVPSSKPKSQPSKGSSGGNPLGFGNTNHLGMTYTPYQPDNGQCKGASQVDKDIQAIKNAGFDVVRVYSTDCSTLENVGAACEKHGLKMIIGIFVKGGGCSASTPEIAQQIKAITSWKKWDLVDMIVAGNEAIMGGLCTASELGQLLDDVKSSCNGAGYSGTYTVSETLNIWQEKEVSNALCSKIDLIAANIHPFFNPNTTPDQAGPFVKSQLEILGEICPGKHPINLECGWPNGPDNYCAGSACAGKKQQETAIKSIQDTVGIDVVFFSTDNDLWKGQNDRNWGCKELFGISASA